MRATRKRHLLLTRGKSLLSVSGRLTDLSDRGAAFRPIQSDPDWGAGTLSLLLCSCAAHRSCPSLVAAWRSYANAGIGIGCRKARSALCDMAAEPPSGLKHSSDA